MHEYSLVLALLDQVAQQARSHGAIAVDKVYLRVGDESGVEKVWDIKSASDWAFKNKFTNYGGYEKIKEDDPFGYLMQGFLYSEDISLYVGAWDVTQDFPFVILSKSGQCITSCL